MSGNGEEDDGEGESGRQAGTGDARPLPFSERLRLHRARQAVGSEVVRPPSVPGGERGGLCDGDSLCDDTVAGFPVFKRVRSGAITYVVKNAQGKELAEFETLRDALDFIDDEPVAGDTAPEGDDLGPLADTTESPEIDPDTPGGSDPSGRAGR